MTAKVVTVGLLASYIRQLFDNDPILADLWVEGEVSELFTSRAGHIYFTLRDDDSQIKSVLFKGMAARQRVLPRLGDTLVVHGRVSTYERDGTYQLYVDVVEHAGAGLAALRFEQLRQKLEAEGLFEPARKRPLPAFPRCIGVVTSEQGAVWHDIQTVLKRRYPLAHLLLSPAPVQGDGAPDGVCAALQLLQEDGRPDVIIVARGGGSADDLACFNDERIARAVFACRVPVISAVGHETDWTIIDLVADVRAATPSAAAELVAPAMDGLLFDLRVQVGHLRSALHTILLDARAEAGSCDRRLEHQSPQRRLMVWRDEVTAHGARIAAAGALIATDRTEGVRLARRSLAFATRACLADDHAQMARERAVLGALDPRGTLRRGYAAIEHASGGVITSTGEIRVGEGLIAQFADGRVRATVDGVDALGGVGHND